MTRPARAGAKVFRTTELSVSATSRLLAAGIAILIFAGCDRLLANDAPVQPNFVIFLADDLGYGDLGPYGSEHILTPHIDRIANQGIVFTEFYASANLCSPSRAGILTGRYPIRSGLANEVLQNSDNAGLPQEELTVAELLQAEGYRTKLVGKWHLGSAPPYWPPSNHGFDEYLATVGSVPERLEPEPLHSHDRDKPNPIPLSQLISTYTESAVSFVKQNKNTPFFLLVSYNSPHTPLVPGEDFRGTSAAYAYGDVVEELDASIGKIVSTLGEVGIAEHTVVFITSDNGPAFEGDVGGLNGRKGNAGYDGGYKVPFIAWGPNRVVENSSTAVIASNVDLLPTILSMANTELPRCTVLDGADLSDLLSGGSTPVHDYLVYFDNDKVAGIRTQDWKLVTRFHYRNYNFTFDRPHYPALYNMEWDRAERFNAAQNEPEIWREMMELADEAGDEFRPLMQKQQIPYAKPASD